MTSSHEYPEYAAKPDMKSHNSSPTIENVDRKRPLTFFFLLPNGSNAFMADLTREAESYAQTLERDGISIHVEPIDAYDGHRVAGTLAILDAKNCNGVAVVAPLFPEVRAAIDRLQDRGVHVVTLVSDHPASARKHFVGIDNRAAGRTAARLMGQFLNGRSGEIALLAGSLGLRDHADRYAGFREVITADYPSLSLLKVREGRDDNTRSRNLTKEILKEHDGVIGLYNMGAGNRGAILALEEVEKAHAVSFIAHELTPYTREAITSGTINALISQDPGHEVRSAVRVLQALCEDRPIVSGQERIGIDVFLKDNLPPET
ncbi:LacI family transcriptional regulator [Roseibium hamelinense]|nr:LacI family transcriptional regulator [Roseibium hamelinense]